MVAVHHVEDQGCGSPCGVAAEDEPAAGEGQHRVELKQLGDQRHALAQPLVGELDDHVPVDRDFAVWQVAHPVVRQVRAHQADVTGREGPDVVARDETSVRLRDEVDLVLRMCAPAADPAREVMGEGSDRLLGVVRDVLEPRGSSGTSGAGRFGLGPPLERLHRAAQGSHVVHLSGFRSENGTKPSPDCA